MSAVALGTCGQQNCSVALDGRCLEGLELKQCPHFLPHEQSTASELSPKVATTEGAASLERIELPEGTALTPEAAKVITQASVTRVIIVAGPPDSGKTTLLTSLYECFQSGPFCDYLFVASGTLPDFERRCYPARIASERANADTERTRPGQGYQLLHLRVRVKDLGKPPQDLLFSDLSGETFRLAKDSTEECKNLTLLQRANRFVLLLDAKRLARVECRAETASDGESLLRSCLDAQMLGKFSLVDVLFTKWDLVQNRPEESATEEYIASLKARMKSRFASRVGRLCFFRVAARPEKGSKLPFAYGLSNIFPVWVEDTGACTRSKDQSLNEPMCVGEFDRYLLRRVGRLFRKELL
jgi:hypothetical protein